MAAPRPALPRVVELVRVSSAGQAARDTPQDQRAALDRLRISRPCQVVERIELQVSGAAAGVDRPDLIRLAELAALRAFDEVRVRHIDRLTRHEDLVERAAVLSMVKRAGAVIIDAGGAVLDPATEGGELMFVFSTMASAQERKRILERTMAGKRRLAAEGRLVCSVPPWGRTFDRATGRWGLNTPAAAVYRRLFDLVLRGRSLSQIADELNAEGVPTTKGRRWSRSNVGNLIRAGHASGLVRSHGAEIRVPPVVDEATQAAAVARLKANDHASGRHDVTPALLRKIVACGVCGGPLYTDRFGWTWAGQRTAWTVYYCAARADCYKAHRIDLVDAKVRELVEAWMRRPSILAAVAEHGAPGGAETAELEAAAAAKELRDLDRQEERLARLSRRGLLSPRVAAGQLEEVGRLRAAAELRAEQARAALASAARWGELAAEAEARVAELRRGLGRAGFAEWRELVELIFPPGSVLLWPDGRIGLRGAVPLDGAGDQAVQEAARELARPSRVQCQIPVRLDAWVGGRR